MDREKLNRLQEKYGKGHGGELYETAFNSYQNHGQSRKNKENHKGSALRGSNVAQRSKATRAA